jgi:hypothetical protein
MIGPPSRFASPIDDIATGEVPSLVPTMSAIRKHETPAEGLSWGETRHQPLIGSSGGKSGWTAFERARGRADVRGTTRAGGHAQLTTPPEPSRPQERFGLSQVGRSFAGSAS